MKKIFYLAMVAVISAFALSCEESSKIKDDDLDFYTWNYTFDIVTTGGMSATDLEQLKAAFKVSEAELEFEATVNEAERAFNASIVGLKNSLKSIIEKVPHTSKIEITIICSSPVKRFTSTLVVE